MKFILAVLLWCILLVMCWPLALILIILLPVLWIILLPFKLVGMVFDLIGNILMFPFRMFNK